MELQQLKYFKTVAECGQINKAAAKLYISSPALSVSISRLEKELGAQLFDRTNNRITLNKQGEIFLEYVEQVFKSLDNAKKDVKKSLQTDKHNIKIAISASNLWLKMLSEYLATHPNVTVSSATVGMHQLAEIDMVNDYHFLLADKSDINQKNLKSAYLFTDYPCVLVPASHPLAEKMEISLQELSGEPLFLPLGYQSLNCRVRRMFEAEKLPLRYVNEFSNMLCEYMVADNRGISIGSKFGQHNYPNVRFVPIKNKTDWEQRIFWNAERQLHPEEEEFKDFVIRFAKENM